MRIVTGFAESFDEQEKEPAHPLIDYLQTIDAIEHNLDVAGNCLARAAKKTLHVKLPDARLQRSSDAKGGLPLWVSENSIAFELKEKKHYAEDWDLTKEDFAKKLSEIVETLAEVIGKTSKDLGKLILVDALKIRVLAVGPQMYRFVVKQMWSVDRDE